MKRSIPAALALTLFPAAGFAQDMSCSDEFAALEGQVTGAALQAEYQGRESAHPLVLLMASGDLVDLTGMIVVATPYESWTGSQPVAEKIGGYLAEAKPFIEAGNEEECLALLELARADIDAFNTPDSDDTTMEATGAMEEEAAAPGQEDEEETEASASASSAADASSEADPLQQQSGEADSPD